MLAGRLIARERAVGCSLGHYNVMGLYDYMEIIHLNPTSTVLGCEGKGFIGLVYLRQQERPV